jgi:hypothetical protein
MADYLPAEVTPQPGYNTKAEVYLGIIYERGYHFSYWPESVMLTPPGASVRRTP